MVQVLALKGILRAYRRKQIVRILKVLIVSRYLAIRQRHSTVLIRGLFEEKPAAIGMHRIFLIPIRRFASFRVIAPRLNSPTFRAASPIIEDIRACLVVIIVVDGDQLVILAIPVGISQKHN